MHQFKDLCNEFNFEWVDNIEERYYKASSKTHPKGNFLNRKALEKFSAIELAEIKRLLIQFDCEEYVQKSDT